MPLNQVNRHLKCAHPYGIIRLVILKGLTFFIPSCLPELLFSYFLFSTFINFLLQCFIWRICIFLSLCLCLTFIPFLSSCALQSCLFYEQNVNFELLRLAELGSLRVSTWMEIYYVSQNFPTLLPSSFFVLFLIWDFFLMNFEWELRSNKLAPTAIIMKKLYKVFRSN